MTVTIRTGPTSTPGIIRRRRSTSWSEIFTQFQFAGRARHEMGRGCERRSSPEGLLIIQGYTPKQLQYGTGGPKQVENLYTRAMLQEAFGDLQDRE